MKTTYDTPDGRKFVRTDGNSDREVPAQVFDEPLVLSLKIGDCMNHFEEYQARGPFELDGGGVYQTFQRVK